MKLRLLLGFFCVAYCYTTFAFAVTKVTASDAAAFDLFGFSVAIHGDTMVVGAYPSGESTSGPPGADDASGAAYVFERNEGEADNWVQVAKLTADDAAPKDWFGYAVAIDTDRIVVTNIVNALPGSASGAAYVFERNAGGADNWGQVAKFNSLDASPGDWFGNSVALSNNTVVVGAYQSDDAGNNSGSAYVFERDTSGNWTQIKELVAADAAANDYFGNSVSIDGDTVVIGSYHDTPAGTNSGSAYVFSRDQGGVDNWGQVAKLTAADAAAGDEFGWSLDINVDTMVVGARGDDDVFSVAGSAYVFSRDEGGADNWGQIAKLTATDPSDHAFFGVSVAIDGDLAVVGAHQDDEKGSNSGATYVFSRDEGDINNWGQAAKLTADDGAADDQFGRSVALHNGTALIGAPFDDDAGSSSGSSYIVQLADPDDPGTCDVTDLEFVSFYSPLDDNPKAGGGLRIFPGMQNPDDVEDRRTVLVRASVGCPGVEVFFRSFDVDDPSSDTGPVDPNDESNGPAGDDNRGTPRNGALITTSAITDGDGLAAVAFAVTMQPGDNFKVAASTDMEYLNGIHADGAVLRDAVDQLLPTDKATATPMLTVWRRLHIEVDSMGPVVGNTIAGTIKNTSAKTAHNRTNLSLAVPSKLELETGRFEGGLLDIDGIGSFSVITNKGKKVAVEGLIPKHDAKGQAFTLVDDDDFNDDDWTHRDGDMLEDIPPPDTGLLQDSDDPEENVFAPAFVRPIYDVGDDNDAVPFVLNTPGGTAEDKISTYDFDSFSSESEDFWVVYLLGGYQHVSSRDGDPNRELVTLGTVDARQGMGATVFHEPLSDHELTVINPDLDRDLVNNAATTAHEIGHLFNGLHDDKGLMSQASVRETLSFSVDTIDRIRAISHP